MTARIIALSFALCLAVGCAAFPAKRTPRLDRSRILPQPEGGLTIELVLHDHSDRPRKTARSIRKARKKLPYLTCTAPEGVVPDYRMELSVEYREIEWSHNALAAYSFMIIPWGSRRQVSVSADVRDSHDRSLGVFTSTGRSTQVAQLHLFWVLPLSAPLAVHVDRKMWSNTFRDVFIQAGEAIAAHHRPEPWRAGEP